MLDSSWFGGFQDADYAFSPHAMPPPGHILGYLITQLAKVLQQDSQLPLNESDDEYTTTWLVCYAE